MDTLLQDITLYHKKGNLWEKKHFKASVRDKDISLINKNAVNDTKTTLIRIFDINQYKYTWNIEKCDIIVLKRVYDDVIEAPITELSNKYGRNNVCEVISIEEYIFNSRPLKKLNHIKLNCK